MFIVIKQRTMVGIAVLIVSSSCLISIESLFIIYITFKILVKLFLNITKENPLYLT